MALNLFNPTGPVAGEEFYGRKAAIAAVTGRLESGQSVLILGQRRIGKTSLLQHLFGFRKPAAPDAHIMHDGFLGRDSTVELLAKSLVRQLKKRT
jgi:ABC-type multidrug transport system ATPase subunit